MCVYVYVESGGGGAEEKRGPALLEVVTSLCVCSIHPWIKALCVRACACEYV